VCWVQASVAITFAAGFLSRFCQHGSRQLPFSCRAVGLLSLYVSAKLGNALAGPQGLAQPDHIDPFVGIVDDQWGTLHGQYGDQCGGRVLPFSCHDAT
jgi:hypothetical protein